MAIETRIFIISRHFSFDDMGKGNLNNFTFDALEPRQHLSATQRFAETEPNSSMRQAMAIDLRDTPGALISGFADTAADRDYYRFKVAAGSRVQIIIHNLSGASLKLRATDAFQTPLASTNKKASFFVDGERSYYLKLQSNSARSAGYRLEVRAFTSEVAQDRLDRLRKGVNLPEWFWNISGDVGSIMRNYIDQKDVTLMKQLGFQHARLPVDVKYFMNAQSPFSLKTEYLDELSNAIYLLHSKGLAVIVCPFGDHQFDLVGDSKAKTDAMAFSWTFSKFLSRFDPKLTFLQTTNEPAGGGAAWQPVQAQLIQTMRSAAPQHTIITATPLYYGATGTTFGTTGALNELSPYRDTNVVYGLHFYEPFVFTHQGAAWAIPGMEYLGGLDYPANRAETEAVASELRPRFTGTRFEPVIDLVRYYGIDQWNRNKIKDRLDVAAAWASRHDVPMILDEFGVYGLDVEDASRYRYLADVRSLAESAGMGWTMWDFGSEFGVVSNKDQKDEGVRYDIVAALNLKTPT